MSFHVAWCNKVPLIGNVNITLQYICNSKPTNYKTWKFHTLENPAKHKKLNLYENGIQLPHARVQRSHIISDELKQYFVHFNTNYKMKQNENVDANVGWVKYNSLA